MLPFLLLSFFLIQTIQQNCEFDFEIVSDLLPETCNKDKKYYTIEDCMPTCKKFPASGKTKCTAGDNSTCIPGYYCKKTSCAADPQSCAIYHAETTDNTYKKAVFKPVCDKDGTWMPKQCKGASLTGRCFCFDKIGNRIHGQAWTNKAENMTCSCSRRKADLASEGGWFVGLHCDSVGNYEPLQCEEGHCWCAESKTGKLDSMIVPEKAMARLPCYKSTDVGNQYLRQCESLKYARAYIKNQMGIHGTTAFFQDILCDGDGSYGFYRIQDGHTYCTWKDDSIIEGYQSDAAATYNQVNCNCARDTRYFKDAGQPMIESCTGSGNYNSYQLVSGVAFCVDQDGFQNTAEDYVPDTQEDCTS